ncbi:glycosyltransferase family 4 protein [Halorussus gelatinilyticus]|uniref:Glycosyltransferase family 4 protein n=1 Tax=Halorussus gelatinilyticus TaxID=2937524 RepID=A0A8U0IFF8_9EURY|nr:glycosyltransferase family 1 protein [Halorussus gelatinilyticus]UPV98941.1 glycosyltransferase family 4 protein [Halorussus gelatinilyticus]
MKVGFYSEPETGSGIGNYEYELLHHLSRSASVDVETITPVEFVVPIVGDYVSFTQGVSQALTNISDEYDVIHLPNQFQAAGLLNTDIESEVVVSVHDIIPYITSKHGNILSRTFAPVYVRGLAEADHLITISEYTKSDLVNNTTISSENISVVYPSVDGSHLTDPAPKEVLNEYNITEPYILYVGQQGSKKNIEVIIEALKSLDEDVDFVIAGTPGNPLQSLRTTYYTKKNGVEDRVLRTGFVKQSVLARLFHSASAFVFPSKYEGYGRPPLESMSVGTPVVASTATAIPEILDDAAILVDPEKPKRWATAIAEMLEDKEKREAIVEKGYKQYDSFSWATCASETVEIYESVVQRQSSE